MILYKGKYKLTIDVSLRVLRGLGRTAILLYLTILILSIVEMRDDSPPPPEVCLANLLLKKA